MDRAVLKNALSLLLVQAANLVLPLITFPYLTRILGPESFGRMALSAALVSYFVLIAEYGFNLSVTKSIAEAQGDRTRISKIFWNALTAKIGLVLLGLVALSLVTRLLPRFAENATVIAATSPLLLGTLLFPQWLFQGIERMGVVSVGLICAKALTVPVTFMLVHEPADVWKAALISSATSVLAGAISIVFIVRLKLVSWSRPTLTEVRGLLASGWHVFISAAAISLYSATNTVLLGFISGDRAVGQFAAADKIRQALSALIGPLNNAVYPRVNALMVSDRLAAFALIRKLLWLQGAVTMLLSIGAFLLAPMLVGWVMGAAYQDAAIILRWLSAIPFIVGISNVLGVQTMLPLGMTRQFTRILLMAGLINLALLGILAAKLGAEGAAIAVLCTEILVVLAMAMELRSRRVPILRTAQGKER